MILPKYKPKDITGYEGLYGVTKDGKVYSFKSNKFLKVIIDKHGYSRVNLHKNGEREMPKIHRLVAQQFIPNPNNYPCINHKSEIKTDNRVENLEWCTYKYNHNYGTCRERQAKSLKGKYGKKIRCIETGQVFNCIRDANKHLRQNEKSSNIGKCCNNKIKTAYGYHWEYVEEYKNER